MSFFKSIHQTIVKSIAQSVPQAVAQAVANSIWPIASALCYVLTVQNNFYSKSALASVTTQRKEEFRNMLLMGLGFDTRKRRRNSTYPCMITGEYGNGEEVVAAHIAPAVSDVKKLHVLGLTFDDIHSIRNGLLLAKAIEEAFDQLRLSFVSCVIPDENGAPRKGCKLKI